MGGILLQDDVNQALSFNGFSGKPEELIPLLQSCQKQYGYISEEHVRQIARFLKISEGHIYGVASFYSQFQFEKPGENNVRVCLGTSCHVQGGEQLSREIQDTLGIGPGKTTPDHRFDFHEVACLGCCALAPVVEINGKIYAKMTPDKLHDALVDHE